MCSEKSRGERGGAGGIGADSLREQDVLLDRRHAEANDEERLLMDGDRDSTECGAVREASLDQL